MEKINNYTPGPWVLRNEEDITDKFGAHICDADACMALKPHQPGNAQLIALAPTLYEQHFKMLELLKKCRLRLSMGKPIDQVLLSEELEQTIKECEL